MGMEVLVVVVVVVVEVVVVLVLLVEVEFMLLSLMVDDVLWNWRSMHWEISDNWYSYLKSPIQGCPELAC